MKQLLVLASFFTIFFFFAGCQSETPVAPVDDINLDKPIKPAAIIGELIPNGSNTFLNLQVEWPSIRGTVVYNVIAGSEVVVVYPPAHSTLINDVAALAPGTSVTVKIIAYKDRRDNPVVIAEGTKTFVYSPPLPEIIVNSNVTIVENDYLSFTADWDDVAGAVKYNCNLIRSLAGHNNDFEVTSSSFLLDMASTVYADCNFTLKVQAINSAGAVIAEGTDIYEYTFTPPALPEIVLTGALIPYENYYLNLNASFDAVSGAVTYHVTNFKSYNGTTSRYDHEYTGLLLGNVNPIIAGVFNIITVEARNSEGTAIAWGIKKFTYTPAL